MKQMVSLSASLDSLSLLVGLKWPYLSFTITGNTHALLYTHPSCPHACPALNISSILTQHSSVLRGSGSDAQEVCLRIPLALGSSWMWVLAFLGHLGSLQAAELISPLGYFSTKQPVDLEFHWCGEHSQPTLTTLRAAAAPTPASGSASLGGGAGEIGVCLQSAMVTNASRFSGWGPGIDIYRTPLPRELVGSPVWEPWLCNLSPTTDPSW